MTRKAPSLQASAAILAAISAVVFGAIYWRVIHYIPSDFDVHLSYVVKAEHSLWLAVIHYPHAHFLFFLLTLSFGRLFGDATFQATASIVMAGAYAVTVVLVHRYLLQAAPSARSWRARAILGALAICFCFLGPASIFTVGEHNLYLGYLTPNTFHNPTMPILMPFAIPLFFTAVALLDTSSGKKRAPGAGHYGARRIASIAALTFTSVLAKPVQIISLLPAGGAIVAWKLSERKPVAWKPILLGIIAPAVAMLAIEFHWEYGIRAVNPNPSHIYFAPFAVMHLFTSSMLPRFALSILFPALVYALHYERAKKSFELGFAWIVFGFAASYVYFLAESGHKFYSGNFLWCTQVALFTLFLASVRFVLREHPDSLTSARAFADRRLAVCAAAFALHLVTGFVYVYSLLAALPEMKA